MLQRLDILQNNIDSHKRSSSLQIISKNKDANSTKIKLKSKELKESPVHVNITKEKMHSLNNFTYSSSKTFQKSMNAITTPVSLKKSSIKDCGIPKSKFIATSRFGMCKANNCTNAKLLNKDLAVSKNISEIKNKVYDSDIKAQLCILRIKELRKLIEVEEIENHFLREMLLNFAQYKLSTDLIH